MAYITWSEMFSVKVAYIDEQHKKLFDIINRFHDSVQREDAKKAVLPILNDLIQYTQIHFRDEEDVMEQLGLPAEELAAHKERHAELMEDVFRVHAEFEADSISSLYDIEVFLNNWMIAHVLSVDKQYERLGRKASDTVPRESSNAGN